MMPNVSVASRIAVGATLLLMIGCRSDTSTSPIGEQRTLAVEAVSPSSISGIVGAVASPTPVIRVTDGKTHQPLANIPVEFAVDGGGYTTNGRGVTDAAGLASPAVWSFSIRPGLSYLDVYVNGTSRLRFKASLEPDVSAELLPVTQVDQAALPGSSANGPTVEVRDRFGNDVSKARVSFIVTEGAGTLQNLSGTSDDHGLVSAGSWKLPSKPGHYRATATVAGTDAIAFDAEVLDPATIKWYALESIANGSTRYTPIEFGVADARIALSPFDPCFCRNQQGHLIEQVRYAGFGGQTDGTSGRYSLVGSTLTIPSLSELGSFTAGELLIQRPDPDSGGFMTWVYKAIDTP
jgi:hypothetical protein